MFIGTNNLILDGKHRMSMPARYRERIKDLCGGNLVVAPAAPIVSPDGSLVPSKNLWLYPASEWEQVMDQVMRLPATSALGRKMQQQFLGNAEEVSLDAGGRLLLPARLREYAGIEKNIALVGQGKRFEIWGQAAHDADTGFDDDSLVSTEQVVDQMNQLAL